MNSTSVYASLTALLDSANISYRVMEHEPAGPTHLASRIRGNDIKQAAKAMVLFAVPSKHVRQYVVAVVGGDRRVDMNALRSYLKAGYVGLAPAEKAEELTGSVMGSVPPFSFHPELKLVVDSRLLANDEIVFNAGRLDVSIFLATRDYVRVAHPVVAAISKEEQPL